MFLDTGGNLMVAIHNSPVSRYSRHIATMEADEPKPASRNDATGFIHPNGLHLEVAAKVQKKKPAPAAAQTVSAFTVASRLARSATLSICAPLSMRFMKPLKAVPGPSSMKRVKPCASR